MSPDPHFVINSPQSVLTLSTSSTYSQKEKRTKKEKLLLRLLYLLNRVLQF